MINQEYKERVRLLLRIIPIISTEECFAVHGGTAINLFVQNLPRYSVDIDLTYIPVEPREASLTHIKERLKEIKAKKRLDGIELQVNAKNQAAYEMYCNYGFTEKSINMELL